MIIAVDGPAASGKGTIARALGRQFGLPHLDSGKLYRAVALAMLRAGLDPGDAAAATTAAQALDIALLDAPELTLDTTAFAASIVSAHPGVRAALVARQRAFADQPDGAVIDGRDIGTVIAPHATAKLFVTASPQVRAARRHAELAGRGEAVALETVLADILARDARDSNRAVSPLVQAADAALLDTSEMSIDAAVERAVALVKAQLAAAA
ncbi:(d)CMP kinase [Polymorphobacter arshaanensis]|uniref:Cytidylate kinase n=1 Tax=Glacieibacterium arshaanense TaxID=2511025 RepID=A0A4Y9EPQ9_9SPHN|nr:(d)CMP kinase [Polymorphobacter arshaanensis]TFU03863.1 (d)CMP kinase [Polymorphobacter arshaanensis]